jgi:transglutaminase-like putative cysteine protease
MTTYTVGCELGYQVNGPSTLILNIEPARTERQTILTERLDVEPGCTVETYLMPESGNRYLKLRPQAGPLSIRYTADVDLKVERLNPATIGEVPPGDLPLEVLPHLYPSRYCPADKLIRWATREFSHLAPGHERVTAVCNWIYDTIEYRRGSSDTGTSAYDTLAERAGVCRDFAHLGISLCRALGIPARFVSGYALGLEPPDFHAVFEAYLGGRWYLFDPTRQAALDGIVRIGVGRDAAEVSFATIFGAMMPAAMSVHIASADGAAEAGPRTTDAVHISPQ